MMGVRADLPAPYDEVRVVIRGQIVVGEAGRTVTAADGSDPRA
jgi:ethanolamine utilization protein EutQ (cupin superfamily)